MISNENLLIGTELFFGRQDDCHIIIDDQRVSRYHFKIVIKTEGVFVEKLATTGQLKLNSIDADKEKLSNDDRISLLNYAFIILDIPGPSADQHYLEKLNEIPDDDIPEPENVSTNIFNRDELFGEDEPLVEEESSDEENATEVLTEEEQGIGDESEDFESFNNESSSEENIESSDEDSFESDGFGNSDNDSFESDGFSGEEGGFDDGGGFGDEGGFDDGGFDDGGFGRGSDNESTRVFQGFTTWTLKLFGSYAPYDRFEVTESEVFIGRDAEKCQIVLNDAEVSSVHAVLKRDLATLTLEDLNSSNGTLYKGERINKIELLSGDEFLIGTTSFTVEILNELLQQEQDILMPVEKNQEIEVEEIVEEEVDLNLGEGGDFSGAPEVKEKSFLKRAWKDKRKRMYLIIGGILLLYLMLESFEPAPPPIKPKDEAENSEVTEAQNSENKKVFPPEILEKLEQNYVIALAKYESGAYHEAKEYLDAIRAIDPTYKDVETLTSLVRQGYEDLARLKQEEEAEKERRVRQLEVEKLVKEAKEATKERNIISAEALFDQILQKDPENLDVPQLRLEIEAYKKEQENKKLEEERKKALRQAMVDKLAPGKALYLREDWFRAILALEKFIQLEKIDEDLIKEATNMLKESKIKLSNMINPLLGKARSLRDGHDLKNAYETYGDILKIDPSNEESLNAREDIKFELDSKSKKIYRDALISESLSLFQEAKDKFLEVQQVSPTDSEYYEKATEKLKNYLE